MCCRPVPTQFHIRGAKQESLTSVFDYVGFSTCFLPNTDMFRPPVHSKMFSLLFANLRCFTISVHILILVSCFMVTYTAVTPVLMFVLLKLVFRNSHGSIFTFLSLHTKPTVFILFKALLSSSKAHFHKTMHRTVGYICF